MEALLASAVRETQPAPAAVVIDHFSKRLALETDCWDVHAASAAKADDFVLLDVRSPDLYVAGHVPGAINLPWRKIIASRIRAWPEDTVFVVYCAGPHCNGADRAALALARLGRPVKIMIGGAIGWVDDGFSLLGGTEPGWVAPAKRSEPPESVPTAMREILSRFADAWARKDLDALMALMTPDCVYSASVGPEPGATWSGAAAVREGIERMLEHDSGSTATIHEVLVSDRHAVMRWTYRTAGDGGPDRSVRGCDVFEFRDALIAHKDAFRKTISG
jgi:rhodanese-related sulfurtransferase/ketosteroid isomerase-like protein